MMQKQRSFYLRDFTDDILSECIAGMCYDGEYYLKNVPEHIAEKLGLHGISYVNFLLRSIWDPAHRLEKAQEHSRKRSQILKKFDELIRSQVKHFRVGKQRVSLMKEAENLDVQSYEPKTSSETRFVAHNHKGLCNQFRNWKIQHQYWEKIAQEITDEDSDSEENNRKTSSDKVAGEPKLNVV